MTRLSPLIVLLAAAFAHAEPGPRDVFREYNMATMMWRVGQRHEWGGSNWGKNLTLAPIRRDDARPFDVDLDRATRAEVVVGYDQCHSGTSGLAIAFNDHEYLRLPVPQTIPEPKAGYMAWPYPTINVPLAHLKSGANAFKLRIDAEPRPKGEGGWYQNLVYAVVLRVYYDDEKPHTTGTLTGVAEGGQVGPATTLSVKLDGDAADVDRVEYIGQYLDFDHDGDGLFREWQYRYQMHGEAEFAGHIGTADQPPFQHVWDTAWLPDQTEPMHLAARIVRKDGVTYFTPELRSVQLVRPGRSVEMCIPYNVPQGWVTRKGRMGEKFTVTGDLSRAVDARVALRGWGGNDEKGGWINGKPFPRFKQPHFEIPVDLLTAGQNTLETDKGGHHGFEVAWPGAVVFIRYQTDAE